MLFALALQIVSV